jgi:putative ATP-binding cassette transporter
MIEGTIRISTGGLLREVIHLLRPFWPLVLFATTIGILSGLATAWLLAAINVGLHSEAGATWPLLVRFAALCLLSVAGTAIAGIGNSVVGQRVIAALRKDISARVLRAPIASLEIQRPYRLMSVLTGDIDTVSAFTFNFSAYVIALATIVGSFLYLLTLSPIVFILAIVSLTSGWIINMTAQRAWIRDYEEVRLAQDELHKQFRAITDGAK